MRPSHQEKKIIVDRLATDLKQANDSFLKLLVNDDYQDLSSKKEMNHLRRALNNINKYTSDMEDRLYEQNLLDTRKFYPGGDA